MYFEDIEVVNNDNLHYILYRKKHLSESYKEW